MKRIRIEKRRRVPVRREFDDFSIHLRDADIVRAKASASVLRRAGDEAMTVSTAVLSEYEGRGDE
jgi:hypothetical protein